MTRSVALIVLADAESHADLGRVLAVDVSPWLLPDATTCPDRSFCHT